MKGTVFYEGVGRIEYGTIEDTGPLDGDGNNYSYYIFSTMPGTVTDLNVRLSLTDSRIGDLKAVLVSPSGVRVPLFDQVGDDGRNFSGTVLDDEAAQPIESGASPFTASFRRAPPLSAFDGLSAAGTWRLGRRLRPPVAQ